MPKDEKMNTTIVSLDDYSFNYLMENMEYAFPGTTKNRRIMEYMAFYRTKPVSAITHYGKVEEVIEDAEVDGTYRLLNFGFNARGEATKVLFKNISELESPVKAVKGKAIQGKYYTKLEYVKKAKTIPELWEMKK